MARKKRPNFRCEKEDVVSVWLATVPFAKLPENYFIENYGGDDDAPFNQFSEDFGFGYYDIDSVETMGGKDRAEVPISELVSRCSYGESFVNEAAAAARKLGVERSCWVMLIYNFKYDPKMTGRKRSPYFQFVGAFPFQQD